MKPTPKDMTRGAVSRAYGRAVQRSNGYGTTKDEHDYHVSIARSLWQLREYADSLPRDDAAFDGAVHALHRLELWTALDEWLTGRIDLHAEPSANLTSFAAYARELATEGQ